MDASAIDAALARLRALALVEDGERGVRTTRRWKGAMLRAASALREEEATSGPIPGNPLVNAIERALDEIDSEGGPVARTILVRTLVALEVAEMPPAAREALGF